jgi:hypothetical protein
MKPILVSLRLALVVLLGASPACGDPTRGAPGSTPMPDAGASVPDASSASADDASELPPPRPDGMRAGEDSSPATATALGLRCAQDWDCASGYCTDGVCCDAACDGVCQSCAQTGKIGFCAPVVDAGDDTCAGASICDSRGTCRKDLGRACLSSSDCASGSCLDGVCCGSASCGTCQSCGLAGSLGRCAPVLRSSDDPDSGCTGDATCNGLGDCARKNGQPCAGDTDCASRECVDGICCEAACAEACFACNVVGAEGTCTPLVRAEDPDAAMPCAGGRYCDAGAGDAPVCALKLADGEPCTFAVQCASGTCGTYYLDADGDGYGARTVQTCGRQPAPGASARGGDCCDADATAHPGVITFSYQPNACGRFDFNCDGVEERPNGLTVACGSGVSIMLPKLGGSDTRVGCR